MEKDLVLDVAQRLGALIEERLGAEVVYTRTDDSFVPLEERTALANERQADLFLSIHANSGVRPATGSESYYLNFATSREFASRVQNAMHRELAKSNGAVSNRREERLLKLPDYRQKVAEALSKGLSDYASTLSHLEVANIAPPQGGGSNPE